MSTEAVAASVTALLVMAALEQDGGHQCRVDLGSDEEYANHAGAYPRRTSAARHVLCHLGRRGHGLITALASGNLGSGSSSVDRCSRRESSTDAAVLPRFLSTPKSTWQMQGCCEPHRLLLLPSTLRLASREIFLSQGNLGSYCFMCSLLCALIKNILTDLQLCIFYFFGIVLLVYLPSDKCFLVVVINSEAEIALL